jgi:uncharacterized protein YacL
MVLHKVFKYLALALALIAGIFFMLTLGAGDEAIQTNDGDAQNTTIVPMLYISYLIIGLIIALVLVFVIKNLFSSKEVLKKSLISIGAMLIVCLLAYFAFADNSIIDPMTGKTYILDDGQALTNGESQLIGASIITFYIVAALAVLAILWSGVRKMLNR